MHSYTIGDLSIQNGVNYMGKNIPPETIINGCSTIVYVIDAQDDEYEDSLPRLVETILTVNRVNPEVHFEVFLHKVDGELMPEEIKAERYQSIQRYVSMEISDNNGEDISVTYYMTSIYDHSALEAFSKVIQKLVNQLPILNALLDKLIESSVIEKSYLLDVFTKLYIATDSNAVDPHTYELCSDLVDVVIDVSCIYGFSTEDGAAIPYDQDSSSAIRLNSGFVLYLREVSKYVALVCVIREEYFARRALLDFNIDCFRQSLEDVVREGENQAKENGNGGDV